MKSQATGHKPVCDLSGLTTGNCKALPHKPQRENLPSMPDRVQGTLQSLEVQRATQVSSPHQLCSHTRLHSKHRCLHSDLTFLGASGVALPCCSLQDPHQDLGQGIFLRLDSVLLYSEPFPLSFLLECRLTVGAPGSTKRQELFVQGSLEMS